MADFDWKAAVKGVAPVLGGLLSTVGGPAGVLVGAGLTAVANALGVPPTEDAVSAAVQAGLTPEQRAALAQSDLEYKKAILDTGLKRDQLAADVEKSYIGDVQAARIAHAQTQGILYLGYIINVASYLCVAAVLAGCFHLLLGEKLSIEPTAAVMVGGIIGSALQWIISNSTQANGFFFGSSPASRQVTTDLAKAVGTGVTAYGSRQPETGPTASTTVNVK